MSAAIEMGTELNTVLLYLASLGKTEDLIAAAVRQDGLVPANELVEPATPSHPLIARPQHQVIGVAENDARTDVVQIAWCQCFNSTLGPDRHEYRRLDCTVSGLEDPAASGAIGMGKGKQMVPTPYYR